MGQKGILLVLLSTFLYFLIRALLFERILFFFLFDFLYFCIWITNNNEERVKCSLHNVMCRFVCNEFGHCP